MIVGTHMHTPFQHATSITQSQIFFSAGEPSGDTHAAALIREIKSQDPAICCTGYGGPLMQQAGMELHHDLTKKAVMFIGIAVSQIYSLYKLYKQTVKYFAENPVHAVVLVDYPGFNWWVARAARQHGIPVYYFMPPQLWAWAGWRVKKMHQFVDHVFTTMPFETKWFQENDCHVIEIGHPFLEAAKHHKLDASFVTNLKTDGRPILTVLPGSRDQEIEHNIDDLLNTIKKVCREAPNVRPMIAAFKQEHADRINQKLSERGLTIPVFVGKTQELIRAAHFALTVSGSVTMELLANHVPTVVYYKINKVGHFVQRFFRRSRFITLVNLLGVEQFTPGSPYYPTKMKVIPAWPTKRDIDDMLFPEFLTSEDMSDASANTLLFWLKSTEHYRHCKDRLRILHQKLEPAVDPFYVAADVLLKQLSQREHDDIDENVYDDNNVNDNNNVYDDSTAKSA